MLKKIANCYKALETLETPPIPGKGVKKKSLTGNVTILSQNVRLFHHVQVIKHKMYPDAQSVI